MHLDLIDKNTLEIKQDEEKTVYKDLQDIGEDLPDHSPRFILLSYPLTLVRNDGHLDGSNRGLSGYFADIGQPSGRLSVPYVLLYYMPATCNAESRMLYAGAKELMRNTAEVGKVMEIDSADDLEDLPKRLGGE